MISIVIPTFNNGPCLDELADRIVAALSPARFEIIFINDGSTDDTLSVMKRLALGDDRIKGLSLSRNFGQHPATGAGLEHASGDIIVVMDADLQDKPEDIPSLIAKLKPGIEIVYTVKQANSDSWIVNATSRLYHFCYAKIARAKTPSNIGTFRAFTRKFLEALLLYKEKNILYGPLMAYMGFPSDVLPVSHDPRAHGTSSYSFLKRLSLAVNSLVTYTDIPYRVLIGLGGSILALSLFYALFMILQYLIVGRILIGGLAVVIMLILFFGGAGFLALGVLGIYVFRIFQEVLDRPRCLVAERLNLPSGPTVSPLPRHE